MNTGKSMQEPGGSPGRISLDRRNDDSEEYADIIPPRSKSQHRDSTEQPNLARLPSGVLNFQDDPVSRQKSNVEVPYEIYERFSKHRKYIIVAVISWCGLLSPISSTAVLSALPEVATEYKTTGDIISLSNAMASEPSVWKEAMTASLFLGCSIGTALSPNVAAFFVFRMLTAFAGTSFLVTGPAVIGDLYHPTERATAMGWFLSGTLIGPTIGPVLGGIIVTYTSWRAIFWLQTALAGVGLGGALFFMPDTFSTHDFLSPPQHNPVSSTLPRGVGTWLVRSSVGALPGCMLIYGWAVQERAGGVTVPVIFMFLGGVSQLFCFPSLNTYCLDVIQGRSAEVIAGNFMIRYLFGAAASAIVLPAIQKIGVGWFSTISATFLIIGALGVWAVAIWGRSWRKRTDEKINS
ncbi:major facilitator superfamily transporter [Colletotrichum graminicola M1.001]|uniref:Major facilitator superfamily transporter n=1 Tax=Colletotrichum graminicola (strain M1.001 / M2 / FGSC 10212) TaxID=645133 RepID=E3QP01_COLGM|nr:major facilitator superfamily transporter [Colletotrichum graminicola M1.001]EFQ32589.1 major facilitator superfamily transporter [Colletotrichum graminicola M1.001]